MSDDIRERLAYVASQPVPHAHLCRDARREIDRLRNRAEQAEERNRRLEAAKRKLTKRIMRLQHRIHNAAEVLDGGWPTDQQLEASSPPDSEPAPTPDGGEGVLEAELEQVCALASAGYKDALCARTECQYVGECVGRCGNPRRHPRTICDEVRRALREPRVPEALQELRFIAYKLGIDGYDDAGATCDSLKRAIIEHASVTGAVRRLPSWWRLSPPRNSHEYADQLDRALAQSEQGRGPTSKELHDKRREQRDKYRPPEGWKMVPAEPTNEMLRAGYRHIAEEITIGRDDKGKRIHGINPELWRVMLAAAPPPDTQEGESDD